MSSTLPVLRFFLIIFACLSNPLASQAQSGPEKPPMLLPEFTMKLPQLISDAVWSLDGRMLAAIPFAHPALQLISVDAQDRRKWGTPFPFQLISTAISPDNQLLAVHQPAHGLNRLWLYSIADRREIARAELPVGGCSPSVSSTGGLAFSLDGSALWVGCDIAKHVNGTYPAAVRLSLRDLQYQEHVNIAGIASSSLPHLRGGRFSVDQGKLFWTQIVTTYATGAQGSRISEQFVRAIDPSTQQEAFPPLKIRTDSGGRFPSLLRYAMVSPQHGLAVVFRALIKREPPLPVGTPDFAFETYDVHTGFLLAEFWSGTEQQDTDSGGQVEHAALIPGSPYLVGAIDASFNPRKHGGLIVWDARTGGIVQRVPGRSAQRVSVSPDGKRIALFSGYELLMYYGRR
jgi:hypothetical protein